MTETKGKRVLVAGATGYLGKFAVQAFKRAGYHVRVLTRSEERLYEAGPFTAPGLVKEDIDDVFIILKERKWERGIKATKIKLKTKIRKS